VKCVRNKAGGQFDRRAGGLPPALLRRTAAVKASAEEKSPTKRRGGTRRSPPPDFFIAARRRAERTSSASSSARDAVGGAIRLRSGLCCRPEDDRKRRPPRFSPTSAWRGGVGGDDFAGGMRRTMKKAALFLGLPILACLGSAAFADMGRMMFSNSKAQVEETSQKAVILHNGREEVLILATEIGATAKTPIIRFIPFPAAPQVSAAPADTFDRLKAVVDKYRLSFVTRWMTKGGGSDKTEGVDVVAAARVGSHDATTIHVSDVAAFRGWVNDYFRAHGLPTAAAYPSEEAIVADYVRRGYAYFVLDRVDVDAKVRLVEPLAFRFASPNLYYPLLTSNSFGGKGVVDLFVAAPVTLCRPGSNDPVEAFHGANVDLTADPAGHGKCLDEDFKASTSVRLVPQENDLGPMFADWRSFFGDDPVYLQAMRRSGDFKFDHDVDAPLRGEARALRAETSDRPAFPALSRLAPPAACQAEPVRGACKGAFEAYWFDAKDGACKSFLWGGCGDPPPFDTLSDCQRACLPQ
jgi:hypothetical protein